MLRHAVLFSAAIFVCGCAAPFGSTRIPPPGTNAYPQPNVTYPTGSNPAGMSGLGSPNLGTTQPGFGTTQPGGAGQTIFGSGQPGPTTNSPNLGTPGVSNGSGSGSFKSSSLFGNGSLTPARFDSVADTRSSSVRFGDTRTPTAQSAIRQGGMPVNDATRAPQLRSNSANSGIPEITDLPAAPYYGGAVNNAASSLPTHVPGYAPGSTNGAVNFGWKSKTDSSGSGGTSLR